MPIQANIVNGAYSGLALLLDAHVPDAPNGCGVIFISGSGWCRSARAAPLERLFRSDPACTVALVSTGTIRLADATPTGEATPDEFGDVAYDFGLGVTPFQHGHGPQWQRR